MDQRIIALEKRISFQDAVIEDLNQIVIEHQKKMDVLEKRLELIQDRIDNDEHLVKKLAEEEPPPHY